MRNDETADFPRWMDQAMAAKYLSISVRQLQALQKAERITASYFLGPRSPRDDKQAIDLQLAEQQPQTPAENPGERLAVG